jgi:hypothetical protein
MPLYKFLTSHGADENRKQYGNWSNFVAHKGVKSLKRSCLTVGQAEVKKKKNSLISELVQVEDTGIFIFLSCHRMQLISIT